MVLGHGANEEETSAALAALVNQYAGILAAQVIPVSIRYAEWILDIPLSSLWT